MTLGQRIQELRKQAGLSQEGLGEALGVSRQAVSKWEGDNGIPELDTLIAMSKLFGITVGQLLGVETPEETADQEEEKAPAGFTEEQVEEILRRYVEESRRQEAASQDTVGHYPIGSWIIAACAVILSIVMVVVVIGKVREVKESVNTLWSNVVDVEEIVTNVRNQVGGLSDELRGVIEEQNSLLSTFEYEVVSFDVEKETVELRLTATLKAYTAGSRVQFVLSWLKTDDTAGELSTDPVEGPRFETTVTIPMNFHLEVDARIHREDSTIYEQPADIIYGGMHPDEYRVASYGRGTWYDPQQGRIGWQVDLSSAWPEQIYPVGAVVVILLNGEEVYRESASVVAPEIPGGDPTPGEYQIRGEAQLEADEKTDELQIWCHVTDNFGRVEKIQLPILGAYREEG